MRYEETSDIVTLLVEAGDEKAGIIRWVNAQRKPVVIVVPEQAGGVFQRPGDFYELKQVMRERETSIALVMPGNERLKYWARRQGFPVFSSVEVCAQMLPRSPEGDDRAQDERRKGGRYATPSNALKLNAALARHAVSRTTEPLAAGMREESPARSDATRDGVGGRRAFSDLAGGAWRAPARSEDMGGERAYGAPARVAARRDPVTPLPFDEERPVGFENSYDGIHEVGKSDRETGPLRLLAGPKDRVLLVLLALLVLGVLGGIGFGYLLVLFPIAMR